MTILRNMLEDSKLKVFTVVAQELNFTKAAKILGISQPAVSQNISDLESILGVKLFNRGNGPISLTPQGVQFLGFSSDLSNLCAALDSLYGADAAIGRQMSIRIQTSDELYAFLLEPMLASFSIAHPQVEFIRTSPGAASQLFDAPDLSIRLIRSSETASSDAAILKLRTSLMKADNAKKIKDGHGAILENSFDILFEPSQAFAATKTCRLLKSFITDYFASLL